MRIKSFGSLLIFFLVATIIISITANIVSSTRTKNVDTIWNKFEETTLTKTVLINQLRARIGYGGIIHNFKNYILRHEPKRIIKIYRDFREVSIITTHYKKIGASNTELNALSEIERTIRAYYDRTSIAEDMVIKGILSHEIDNLVKVNDEAAIAALKLLESHLAEQHLLEQKRVHKAVEGSSTIGFISSAVITTSIVLLSILFFIFTHRRVSVPLTRLSETMTRLADNELQVSIPYKNFHDEIGDMAKSVSIFKDNAIKLNTQRKQLVIYNELIYRISTTQDPIKALQVCIESICQYISWDIAHVYLYNHELQQMKPSNIWYHTPNINITELREATLTTFFNKDEGLPGRVLSLNQPVWLENVQDNPNFVRAKPMSRIGIHTAIGIPINVNGQLYAMLEFFSRDKLKHDEDLIKVISGICIHVSQLLERIAAESNVRERDIRTKAILETAGDAILSINKEGIILSANAATHRMFGYTDNEILGHNIKMLMPSPYRDEHDQYIANYFKSGVGKIIGIRRELSAQRKSGDIFPCEISVVEINLPNEIIFTGFLKDISDRKQQEQQIQNYTSMLESQQEELLHAKERAEETNRMKSEFLATMSHEIRTPMNGVVGMAELLLSSGLNEKQHRQVNTIVESANNLLDIINEILDFSKIESGHLDLEEEPIDLINLVEHIGDLVAHNARENGVDVMVKYSPKLPRSVMGDALRIRQIILNLAGNAVKFTKQGHILIEVKPNPNVSPIDGYTSIQVDVVDTGIGISEDAQQKIFDRFQQADSSTTRQYGGTGLGLSICCGLIEMMGGNISVDSTPEKGSTFSFSLTLPVHTESDVDYSVKPNMVAPIISHNELYLNILADQTGDIGVQSHSYVSGREALMDIISSPKKYNFVITDQITKDVDGTHICTELASHPETRHIPVIVLTSDISKNVVEKIKNSPAKSWMPKPVNRRDLANTINQLWQTDDQKVEESESAKPLQNIHVLLVEDNRTNREIETESLTSMGATILSAENGLEACQMTINKHQEIDIILMDCQMPIMDGFESAKRISQHMKNGEIRTIPIIALTANAIKGDAEKCLEAGMCDYLSKPVHKQQLQNKILKWHTSQKNAAPSLKEENTPPPPENGKLEHITEEAPIQEPHQDEAQVEKTSSPQNGLDTSSQTNGVDESVIVTLMESLGDGFNQVLEYYLEDGEKFIGEIKAAIAEHNLHQISDPSHTLKSSSKQVGALALGDLAEEIETISKKDDANDEDFEKISTLLPSLESEFISVKKNLRNILSDASH